MTIQRSYHFCDFFRMVGENKLPGVSQINEFGQNPTLGTSRATLMDANIMYNWMDTAQQLKIYSDDVADDVTGTGAQKVYLNGLDSNWNMINETVDLDGTNTVTTTKSFLRLNGIKVLQAGSGETNQGQIDVDDQSDNTITQIPVNYGLGFGKAHAAVYTIPNHWNGYLIGWHTSERSNSGIKVELWIRYIDDNIWHVDREAVLVGNEFERRFCIPICVPAKTDIELRAISAQAGAYVVGGFTGYMIHEDVKKYYM